MGVGIREHKVLRGISALDLEAERGVVEASGGADVVEDACCEEEVVFWMILLVSACDWWGVAAGTGGGRRKRKRGVVVLGLSRGRRKRAGVDVDAETVVEDCGGQVRCGEGVG